MKKRIQELKWRIKIFLLKLRYPKAGYYTRIVLANNFTIQEIDKWVEEEIYDKDTYVATIHELREYVCEVETSYWDE